MRDEKIQLIYSLSIRATSRMTHSIDLRGKSMHVHLLLLHRNLK
jgi:hypothetical protein